MKRILIIRFSSLGDVVLTTGVIKYIKSQLPDILIDVLTMSPFAGVFADNHYVENVYCIDKGAKLETLVDVLNTMPHYDYVFDLHSNLRSRIVKLIMPAPNATYRKDTLARRFFVKFRICGGSLKQHVTEKYLEPFVKPLGILRPPVEELRPWIHNTYKDAARPHEKIITIHPFASRGGKVWPYFSDLCRLLLDNGLHVRAVGQGKIELPRGVEDLTGFTPLNILIRNIADSDVMISTDSGPMHIAIALNVPTLAIFGPTSRELGFMPLFAQTRVIEDKDLKCRPCDIHGPNTCPLKHFQCMRSINIEEVRHHIIKMMDGANKKV